MTRSKLTKKVIADTSEETKSKVLHIASRRIRSQTNGFIGKVKFTYTDYSRKWIVALALIDEEIKPVRSTLEDYITKRHQQRHGVVTPIK